MTQVKLNTDLGGNKIGDIINVTKSASEQLIADGYAESAEQTDAKPKSKSKGQSNIRSKGKGGGASPA